MLPLDDKEEEDDNDDLLDDLGRYRFSSWYWMLLILQDFNLFVEIIHGQPMASGPSGPLRVLIWPAKHF